ncbi:putative non-specific serine/threonine protein kinase [Helianthus debilis subsp. tardiflorus]
MTEYKTIYDSVQNVDNYSLNVCLRAWKLHEPNTEIELVDEELSNFDENEVKRVTRIALLCTQTSPMQRPPMSRVVAMLSGDIEAD